MTKSGTVRFWIVFPATLLAGLAIAWIDSRPAWDDTGITAALTFIAAGAAGFVYNEKPWLWALLTGVWIPLRNMIYTGDYTSAIALLIAFAGAYSGFLLKKGFPD